jgi:hypothetical protein
VLVAVIEAREKGNTWASIARAMGVSRQAAQKRFFAVDEMLGVEHD